jgi:hypothetical protein
MLEVLREFIESRQRTQKDKEIESVKERIALFARRYFVLQDMLNLNKFSLAGETPEFRQTVLNILDEGRQIYQQVRQIFLTRGQGIGAVEVSPGHFLVEDGNVYSFEEPATQQDEAFSAYLTSLVIAKLD